MAEKHGKAWAGCRRSLLTHCLLPTAALTSATLQVVSSTTSPSLRAPSQGTRARAYQARRRRRQLALLVRKGRRHVIPALPGCQWPLPTAATHPLPAEPVSEGLKRQDTPWPGWDSEQQEHGGQGGAGQGKQASGGSRRQGKAGRQGSEVLPEEEPEGGGSEGGGFAAAGGTTPQPRTAGMPVGGPPEHPHHAGKPPAPAHGLLDAEQGNAADDLIPPVGEPDQP